MTESTRAAAPLGRREQNKADKLRRIRSTAAALFNERGYEATTTGAIASGAGIAKGTLFLYAPTKEDLLVAVFIESVGDAWDEAFSLAENDRPILDQLVMAFDHVTLFHERDPGLSRAFLKELQFVSGPASDDLRSFMQRWSQRLESLLASAVDRRELVAETPTGVLGNNLFAAWYTLIQQRHGGRIELADLRSACARSFAVQLQGFTANPSSTNG